MRRHTPSGTLMAFIANKQKMVYKNHFKGMPTNLLHPYFRSPPMISDRLFYELYLFV